jgi:LPXTG-motif cell wall-anchored protein
MGTRALTRVAAALAGGALALMAASPALADDTIPINDGNVPTTAEDHESHQCDDQFDPLGLGDDEDGWHFVVGGNKNFTSLTLTFESPADGTVTVVINSTDPNNPSENADPFWAGYIGSPDDSHAWVITEAGWTLVDGEADVDEAPEQPQFQLSHTCPGTPPPDKSPSPTPSVTPSEPMESTPPGDLPKTGAPLGALLVLASGLVAAGIAMLAVRRRRNLSDLLEG